MKKNIKTNSIKKLFTTLVLFQCIPTTSFAHSGNTDSSGCHNDYINGGYHCHNGGGSSGSSFNFDLDSIYDINIGYQHHISDTSLIPYIGFSVGIPHYDSSTKTGTDYGLRFEEGLYLGYNTASESYRIGYKKIHISFNNEYIGLGFKLPLTNDVIDQSALYFSGSYLVK
ncbi:hypothetical protein BEI46_06980 [Aliivibrio fischeri]|uniref:YHYH domain-containing protein n=1 Tax=Aliivibrio fischeri TaxID=668 RepID=UPI00084C8542|nr:YHYH domain-containing protein [Aliivibrio fischeri]OED51203.1 hypothetical protein BEI46_06980 [Aliivibrio fischeri]